jgi:predicted DNA-binding mobile mystery protein A
MKNRKLFLKQIDQQLSKWQIIKKLPIPREGWIKTIRKALGMTTIQLAAKMGVYHTRISTMEQAELQKAITLNTLNEVANNLNCDLIYAFIPRNSIKNILKYRAQKIALQKIAQVSHNMSLEKQSLTKKQQQEQYQLLVKELLDGNPKHLWSD